MREKNRNPIASIKKLPQFTTMNVIDGQAGLVIYSSLIFYSLTIDNILNMIVLLILAGVAIVAISGENGVLSRSKQAEYEHNYAQAREEIVLAVNAAKMAQESPNEKNSRKVKAVQEEISGFRQVIKGELDKVTNNSYSPREQDEINTATEIKGINKGVYGYTINLDSGIITDETKENQEIADNPEEPNPPEPVQVQNANPPKLSDGMIPIKWDSENSTWVICKEDDPEWYNYVDQTGTNDGQSMWANVMLGDGTYKTEEGNVGKTISKTQLGSMYVWIPRYAYSITSMYHNSSSSSGGDVQIAFLEGTKEYPDGTQISYKYQGSTGTGNITNASGQGNWNEHPAFTFGDKKVAGIWVAKFEAGNANCTTSSSTGATSYSSKAIKIQPDKTSWRNIEVSEIYDVCREMQTKYSTTYGISTDTNVIDTHMMKNREWGACAYLSQSSYGRNKHEVSQNTNRSYLTGGGNYTSNVVQSTTKNVTGIYDMNGGTFEYVAGYVNNGNSSLTEYGKSLVDAEAKYKDVYNPGSSDTGENNYQANSGKYGDAVYETSSQGTSANSWYGDYSNFPYSNQPFFKRGCQYSDSSYSGLFGFHLDWGFNVGPVYSFRPVLVVF